MAAGEDHRLAGVEEAAEPADQEGDGRAGQDSSSSSEVCRADADVPAAPVQHGERVADEAGADRRWP